VSPKDLWKHNILENALDFIMPPYAGFSSFQGKQQEAITAVLSGAQ